MRLKKQKQHRRSVTFYKTCFDFREPFKVLCDGTFIHHLLVNRITPADIALSKILSGTVKLFTTRCVLAELKALGKSYTESLNAAYNLIPARCEHEKRKSAVDCISEVIGENNSEHFFVGSQDADLRKKLQEIPSVPVIYALRNALFLEPPSASQQQFAKSAEEARLHMTDLEIKMLHTKKKTKVDTREPGDTSDVYESEEDQDSISRFLSTHEQRKKENLSDRVQFKRNRAKGPNPLSCRKKKHSGEKPKLDSEKPSSESGEAVRSRGKKRKRPRKKKTSLRQVAGLT